MNMIYNKLDNGKEKLNVEELLKRIRSNVGGKIISGADNSSPKMTSINFSRYRTLINTITSLGFVISTNTKGLDSSGHNNTKQNRSEVRFSGKKTSDWFIYYPYLGEIYYRYELKDDQLNGSDTRAANINKLFY